MVLWSWERPIVPSGEASRWYSDGWKSRWFLPGEDSKWSYEAGSGFLFPLEKKADGSLMAGRVDGSFSVRIADGFWSWEQLIVPYGKESGWFSDGWGSYWLRPSADSKWFLIVPHLMRIVDSSLMVGTKDGSLLVGIVDDYLMVGTGDGSLLLMKIANGSFLMRLVDNSLMVGTVDGSVLERIVTGSLKVGNSDNHHLVRIVYG
jgi:hypothetical protein